MCDFCFPLLFTLDIHSTQRNGSGDQSVKPRYLARKCLEKHFFASALQVKNATQCVRACVRAMQRK
jgi:hypothetical protein